MLRISASPNPLSKGEGFKKQRVVQVLSFGEDYSYCDLLFMGIHDGFAV